MKVHRIHANLSSRDADLTELRRARIEEVDLDSILPASGPDRTEAGGYESIQGPTISPVPLWAVEIQTFRRNVGGAIQEGPRITGSKVAVESARRALKVSGTGSEKEKWRDSRMAGDIQPNYLFAIGTSTWLVPFAIGHRYLACLPATPFEGRLRVHHELCAPSARTLKEFAGDSPDVSPEIRQWTRRAQQAWTESKKEAGDTAVTKYLDYSGKLSRIHPGKPRVIHTRSRTFYSALMMPDQVTALGIPMDRLRLVTREDGKAIHKTDFAIGGLLVDNKVHYVDVDDEVEGHWLATVFNSAQVTSEVMARAKGEPPNIYSIPAQVLADMKLRFDPRNSKHQTLARLGKRLATRMEDEARSYLIEAKGLDVTLVDDSVLSQEVPSLIATRFLRLLRDLDEWKEANEIVGRLLEG